MKYVRKNIYVDPAIHKKAMKKAKKEGGLSKKLREWEEEYVEQSCGSPCIYCPHEK